MSELHRFLDEARGLLPAAVALRRRIHQKPELGLDLPLTTAAGNNPRASSRKRCNSDMLTILRIGMA